MKKIQIIGFSGSGKSTLAGILAERLSLPVLYLDTVYWLPGWKERSREKQSEILGKFLADHPDGWVIDGNYRKNHYDERMEERWPEKFVELKKPREVKRFLESIGSMEPLSRRSGKNG